MEAAINDFGAYICNQVLATDLQFADALTEGTELNFDDFDIKAEVIKA